MSRLQNLSWIDFEDLCRDVAYAETGLRFSAFGLGPDGGIDGRHSEGGESTILQCKHYVGSTFSKLKTAIKNEAKNLDRLKPNRYILFTSQSLTPNRSNNLAVLLGSYLKNSGDIWGQQDIEDSLRRNPTIEKSHPKLWLGSAAALEKILQSGLEAYTQATEEEILKDLEVYVRNNSFDEAINKLEEQKILVISGPPGVGKTTLARMLSYYYLNEGWKFCAINTLDDGFARLIDETPTLFFFDDFLGRIKLDRHSLLQRESAFSVFIRRIRNSTNARFILTTRAHIFEEARQISDYVDDQRLQLSKYLLDVGKYSRRIRAYILYNHLAASSLSPLHIEALLRDDWLKRIIDHKNYNPRSIAAASSDCIDSVMPEKYPNYLFKILESPELIWRKAFLALDIKSHNLFVTLYFGSEFREPIERLRNNFGDLHRTVCAQYNQSAMPTDFDDALKSLESGFVAISGSFVSFVNPSLRDFLKAYLVDQELLLALPAVSKRSDWGRAVWRHVEEVFKLHPDILQKFALEFFEFATKIHTTWTLGRYSGEGDSIVLRADLALADRLKLLLEWWESSGDDRFIVLALKLLQNDEINLVPWSDGRALPMEYWWVEKFVDETRDWKNELLQRIVERLADVIRAGVSIDDLVSIIKSAREYIGEGVPLALEEAVAAEIHFELSDTEQAINHLESEGELLEHIEHLDALEMVTGESAEEAKEIVRRKLGELEEREYSEHKTSFSEVGGKEEEFGDEAVRSLFFSLLD